MQLSQEQMDQLFGLLLPQSVKDAVVAFVNSILASVPQGGGFSQADIDAAVASAVMVKKDEILAAVTPLLVAHESALEAQVAAAINA